MDENWRGKIKIILYLIKLTKAPNGRRWKQLEASESWGGGGALPCLSKLEGA